SRPPFISLNERR
nr:Chain K, Nedd2-like caspase CG8091-PA [synthetic construct]1Q4Q_L Chain L, Nedd2-like caspase CG8091-PA [synthetic construct]1Q4Q_M Chain M, Nedd2-like caspase CG8091-PA [synthetic construct]1Q4Q_N Chain N, Nedd2-like caspase CG8091-PA [synthetic construct]1Q4Q_O Chain O, Nedd2-like caspase CG8091-PA [synthetic construct]1Q4Q_P Chain P, Nedd2-like caspase CG8091-PA [synthetic construct]1Q4Q_Q Chain Q, Nedd2-like caspase CG8091-PA [synthetic construct]1Q4Q_R Chain R, Nedd2-like caspase CG8